MCVCLCVSMDGRGQRSDLGGRGQSGNQSIVEDEAAHRPQGKEYSPSLPPPPPFFLPACPEISDLAPTDLERKPFSLPPAPLQPTFGVSPRVYPLCSWRQKLPSFQEPSDSTGRSGCSCDPAITCELGLGKTRGSLVPCWDRGPGNTRCDLFSFDCLPPWNRQQAQSNSL